MVINKVNLQKGKQVLCLRSNIETRRRKYSPMIPKVANIGSRTPSIINAMEVLKFLYSSIFCSPRSISLWFVSFIGNYFTLWMSQSVTALSSTFYNIIHLGQKNRNWWNVEICFRLQMYHFLWKHPSVGNCLFKTFSKKKKEFDKNHFKFIFYFWKSL